MQTHHKLCNSACPALMACTEAALQCNDMCGMTCRGPVNKPDVKGFMRIPLSRQIGLLLQLAKALQHCHAQRHIAHLDVKPDNILMMGPDTLQLTDFGCVQYLKPGTAIPDQSAEE